MTKLYSDNDKYYYVYSRLFRIFLNFSSPITKTAQLHEWRLKRYVQFSYYTVHFSHLTIPEPPTVPRRAKIFRGKYVAVWWFARSRGLCDGLTVSLPTPLPLPPRFVTFNPCVHMHKGMYIFVILNQTPSLPASPRIHAVWSRQQLVPSGLPWRFVVWPWVPKTF